MNDNGYLQNLLWIGMASALLVLGLAASVSFLNADEAAFPAASCLLRQPELSPSFEFCGTVESDLADIRARPGGLYDPSPGNLYQDLIDRARGENDEYLAAYLLALRAASSADRSLGDAVIADASGAIELMTGKDKDGAGLIRALGYAVLGEVALEAGDGGAAARYFLRAEQEYRDPGSGSALYAAAALMELRSKYDLHLSDFSSALGHADDAALAYLGFGLPNEASRVLFRLAEVAAPDSPDTALAMVEAGERYGCDADDAAYCQFARQSAVEFRRRLADSSG